MVEIRRTTRFKRWLEELRDPRAIAKILIRIDRLAAGNPGDVKPVGEGVSEMRIDYGPGYRVYYAQRRGITIILLVGGDKSTQRSDVRDALKLAAEWKEQDR